MVAITVLILALTTAVVACALLVQHAQGRSVDRLLLTASDSLVRTQLEGSTQVRDQQSADQRKAMVGKLAVLAHLLADISPTPVLTMDTATLDQFCATVERTDEVVLAAVVGPDGTPISGWFGPKAKALGPDLVAALAGAGAKPGFLVTRQSIAQDGGTPLGAAVVVASDRFLQEATVATTTRFANLQDHLHGDTEQMVGEVRTTLEQARRQATLLLIATSALGLVVAGVVAWRIGLNLVRPIQSVASILDRLATGDLTGRVALVRSDEVGRMAAALDGSLTSLEGSIRQVTGAATTVQAATKRITSVNRDLDQAVGEAADRTGRMAGDSQVVSEHTGSIAAAVTEMEASISDIAKGAQHAASVASEAVTLSEGAQATMDRLGQQSDEINAMVVLITEVAERTNLLALNATIEAASAGEAGRGFAVVANEVKELSRQVHTAAEQVAARAGSIRDEAASARTHLKRISTVVADINQAQHGIAAAVEEQSATTRSISGTVTQVADRSKHITQQVQELAALVQGLGGTSREARSTADELERLAGQLQAVVAGFRTG